MTETASQPAADAAEAYRNPAADWRFLIRDVTYQYPVTFKLTDCVLVRELCAAEWDEFEAKAKGWDSPTGHEIDNETLFLGLIACAVSRKNPDWPRDQVIKFVQSLDEEEVELLGFDAADPSGAQSPPGESSDQTTTTGTIPEPSLEALEPPPA